MKKWQIKHTGVLKKLDSIIEILLDNRGIKTKKEKEEFLSPKLSEIIPKNVGINLLQLKKAIGRISKAVKNKEQIVVFGDYDVDGITGSAIIWETLHKLGAVCTPYIPNRLEEGYGLSIAGITNLIEQIKDVSLIITVDNGIVANEAVLFAKKQGIDVIITDHHTISKKLPEATAIVHTTSLCGAGIAYVLSKELIQDPKDTHLELAALGTVADLVPLIGANRTIVTHGLQKLRNTKRPGLLALFRNASISPDDIGMYEIGYIIAPRLNASGRLASAMDSLRLLCTSDSLRAERLAANLEITNKERQQLLKELAEHAKDSVHMQKKLQHVLIVADETYAEGVIGLVAGKLVEEFSRPAIVIAKGQKHSKGSARSIKDVNIVELLRANTDLFVNIGGHPMAAGFTIETEKIILLKQNLELMAKKQLKKEQFVKTLTIDCEIPISLINQQFYTVLQTLSPFGMANPEPTFVTKNVKVVGVRLLGDGKKHVKFSLQKDDSEIFDAIGFGMADQVTEVAMGDSIDVVYAVDQNRWNGNVKLQLKLKDIRLQ